MGFFEVGSSFLVVCCGHKVSTPFDASGGAVQVHVWSARRGEPCEAAEPEQITEPGLQSPRESFLSERHHLP